MKKFLLVIITLVWFILSSCGPKSYIQFILEVDTSQISKKDSDKAVQSTIDILRNRIKLFGINEFTIDKIDQNRILVKLPYIRDANRAKDLICKAAFLEFNLLANNEDIKKTVDSIDNYLKNNYEKYVYLQKLKKEKATALEEALLEIEEESADTIKQSEIESGSEHLFSSLIAVYGYKLVVKPENLKIFRKVISLPEIKKIMPSGIKILLGKVNPKDVYGTRPIYFLYDKVELTGAFLKTVDVRIGSGMDPKTANKPYVSLEFNNEGARIFANVTGQHIKERLAIVLDNVVFSAPVIQDKIRGGNAQITGNFTMEEAKDLAIILRAGNLPAPINIVEERNIIP